jgi:hypothetical protein
VICADRWHGFSALIGTVRTARTNADVGKSVWSRVMDVFCDAIVQRGCWLLNNAMATASNVLMAVGQLCAVEAIQTLAGRHYGWSEVGSAGQRAPFASRMIASMSRHAAASTVERTVIRRARRLPLAVHAGYS